jgi:proliferating cell nuclear antigen
MTFRLVAEVDTLSDALAPVRALVDECKLRLTEDGLSIRAVDPANVAMVDLTAEPAAFEAYEADGGVIGVNLDRLDDVIGMGESDDLVTLDLDESDRTLSVAVGDRLSFSIALIDPDTIREEPDIPDLDLPASVAMRGEALDRGVSAADLVSKHIHIRTDLQEEAVRLAAEGDTDDVELTLGNADLVDAEVAESTESCFSLDYLSDMSRPIGSDVVVSCELGTEMPVKLRYPAAEGVSVTNMLAPRIENS